jgi:hypothetical protein
MVVKIFRITLCKAILSPPYMQQKKNETSYDSKIVYKCSMTFQNVTKSKGWKKLNLMHNGMQKNI